MINDINKALEVLKAGGIILYPTDTIWGIGCDAENSKAIEKIYSLKQRAESKSMIVLVDSSEKLNKYVNFIPDVAWQLIELTEKPLTVIYPEGINLPNNILADDGSIGIRIVNDEFCKNLIYKLRKPLVSTSANLSGQPAPQTFSQIPEAIKNGVDYIVQWRQTETKRATPSSIIKLEKNNVFKIIRN